MTVTYLRMGGSSLALTESPEPAPADALDADERMRRLVTQHYDFVWRVLRRLGVPASLTEDAAQDVFIVVDRKTREFWPQNEKSYLFAVALRVAAEKRRREHRGTEQLTPEAWAQFIDDSAGPDDQLQDRRARAAVDQILERMPYELRVVFVLFELEDMTTQEIAEALSIPSGTVASRLRRGRELFQQAVHRLQVGASRGGEP